MAVNPVMNGNNNVNGTRGGTSADYLTQSFMTLLVAQMQNQDPTNPMDNNQLTSQLAQFNTAAGVEKLNSTLESVGMLVGSMQQLNVAEWVGRDVYIEGDTRVGFGEDANHDFAFALGSDAETVKVNLQDANGNTYTAELKNVKAGVNKYTLDDLTNFQPATPPADGEYSVTYSASTTEGDAPEIQSLKKAKVEGVSFTPTGALIQLGKDGAVGIGDIVQIL
ncbi:flagellar hook capping FlgD N-terminal domain-containing protein [Pantoea dispersa]|uniref:flagellar hook assembly protein FlgD n=1 Tax=Pantoea dispersa TaxID=59814 RepID=UPI0030CAA6B9